MVKKKRFKKAKLCVPAPTCGRELWVVTERIRLRIEAAEMSFLGRVAGLTLRNEAQSFGRGVTAPSHHEEPVDLVPGQGGGVLLQARFTGRIGNTSASPSCEQAPATMT